MGASITLAGESLIAQKQSANQILDVTHFVLANIPNLDTTEAVDRAAGLPPADQIVFTQDVTHRGYLSPNQVVYSLMLATNVGDFDFNWIGLKTVEGVLLIAAYVPRQQKRKEIPPLQTGNNLTRNIVLKYDGAQALTGIDVPASTWQFDFSAEFAGIHRDIDLLQLQMAKKVDRDTFVLPQAVSLDGPTLVYPGSTNTYKITDYNSPSIWELETDTGTISRSGDTITLVIASNAVAGVINVTVKRDGTPAAFKIPLGAASIAIPQITAPAAATNVELEPAITCAAFQVYPAGYDTLKSVQWQVARDAAFTDLVMDKTIVGTATTVNLGVQGVRLESGKRYYTRVKHIGNTLQSAWSATSYFNTATIYVRTPAISSPIDGATNIPESPVLQADAFSVSGATDLHLKSDWQVLDAAGAVAWQSLDDSTNKTSIIVPAGVLQAGSKTFKARVRYHSVNYGASGWSPVITFMTAAQFVPTVSGTAFAGGYYVGRYRDAGQLFALIVAPKASGERSSQQMWTGSGGYAEANTATSTSDGLGNTTKMAVNPQLIGPVYARALRIGGYDDWYIPARDELEMCYRNLKPTTTANALYSSSYQITPGINNSAEPKTGAYTANSPQQTTNTAFRSGGSEAFEAKNYWCSGPAPVGSYVGWVISLQDGRVDGQNYNLYNSTPAVRAVRRVPIAG